MTDPMIVVMDVSHSFEVDASVVLSSVKGAMGDRIFSKTRLFACCR